MTGCGSRAHATSAAIRVQRTYSSTNRRGEDDGGRLHQRRGRRQNLTARTAGTRTDRFPKTSTTNRAIEVATGPAVGPSAWDRSKIVIFSGQQSEPNEEV